MLKKKHGKKQPQVAQPIPAPEFVPTTPRPVQLNQQPVNQVTPPTKKKRMRWLIVSLLVLTSIIALAVVSGLVWYTTQLTAKSGSDIYHVVTVEPGDTTNDIAQQLERNQIIKSANAMLIYTKVTGAKSLQAGSYRLSSKMSTPEIINILESGKTNTTNVLFLPGQRLSQIKQQFINLGYSEAEVDAAFESARSHPLLKGLPKSAPIEGYLFPDTYNIAPGTSAEQLVTLMVTNFSSKITPTLVAGLKKQGLSLQQAIILASIIQKEVKDYPNERKVAQVFLKRLNEGGVLGSDVTYQYAAAETGQTASPELDSPYNTRKVAGLPPTAIANFNITALQAIANPSKTDYHYFVAGDDGTVYYSKTEEEHEALTRLHCASCFQ